MANLSEQNSLEKELDSRVRDLSDTGGKVLELSQFEFYLATKGCLLRAKPVLIGGLIDLVSFYKGVEIRVVTRKPESSNIYSNLWRVE